MKLPRLVSFKGGFILSPFSSHKNREKMKTWSSYLLMLNFTIFLKNELFSLAST